WRANFRHAAFTEAGVWKSDADSGAAGGLRAGDAGSVSAGRGRMGADGRNASPAGRRHRGRDGGGVADILAAAAGKERDERAQESGLARYADVSNAQVGG